MSATHMAHAYDFYKPSGLYPAVDGPLSVYCYLQTLDLLYSRYTAKWERRNGRPFRLADAGALRCRAVSWLQGCLAVLCRWTCVHTYG
jgi:hypothetical protein